MHGYSRQHRIQAARSRRQLSFSFLLLFSTFGTFEMCIVRETERREIRPWSCWQEWLGLTVVPVDADVCVNVGDRDRHHRLLHVLTERRDLT